MATPAIFPQIFSAFIPTTEKLIRKFPCTLEGCPPGRLYISANFVCYFAPQLVYVIIPIKTILLLQKGAFCLVVVEPERTSQFVMKASHIVAAYNCIQELLPAAHNACAHCGRPAVKNNACSNCNAGKAQLIRQVESLFNDRDSFVGKLASSSPEGFVQIEILHNLKTISASKVSRGFFTEALSESQNLQLSPDRLNVRRKESKHFRLNPFIPFKTVFKVMGDAFAWPPPGPSAPSTKPTVTIEPQLPQCYHCPGTSEASCVTCSRGLCLRSSCAVHTPGMPGPMCLNCALLAQNPYWPSKPPPATSASPSPTPQTYTPPVLPDLPPEEPAALPEVQSQQNRPPRSASPKVEVVEPPSPSSAQPTCLFPPDSVPTVRQGVLWLSTDGTSRSFQPLLAVLKGSSLYFINESNVPTVMLDLNQLDSLDRILSGPLKGVAFSLRNAGSSKGTRLYKCDSPKDCDAWTKAILAAHFGQEPEEPRASSLNELLSLLPVLSAATAAPATPPAIQTVLDLSSRINSITATFSAAVACHQTFVQSRDRLEALQNEIRSAAEPSAETLVLRDQTRTEFQQLLPHSGAIDVTLKTLMDCKASLPVTDSPSSDEFLSPEELLVAFKKWQQQQGKEAYETRVKHVLSSCSERLHNLANLVANFDDPASIESLAAQQRDTETEFALAVSSLEDILGSIEEAFPEVHIQAAHQFLAQSINRHQAQLMNVLQIDPENLTALLDQSEGAMAQLPEFAALLELAETAKLSAVALMTANFLRKTPDYAGCQQTNQSLLQACRRLSQLAANDFPEYFTKEQYKDLLVSDLRFPSRQLNFYENLKAISSDSRHSVYTGAWLGQPVALKLYPATDLNTLQRENRIINRVSSPFVVSVNGYFEDSAGWVLEMPFYAEGTLADWIKSPHRPNEIMTVACELLQGVAELHRWRVIHADLKPANIFMADGHVKIGDFDISRPADQRATWIKTLYTTTAASSVGGTLCYAAPELLAGEEIVGQSTLASDIYSLGLIILELLPTGQLPRSQLPVRDCLKPPDLAQCKAALPEVLQPLLNLVATMLRPPAERPSADQLLSHPLFVHLSQAKQHVDFPIYWELQDARTFRRVDLSSQELWMNRMTALLHDSSVFSETAESAGGHRLGPAPTHPWIVHGRDGSGSHHGFDLVSVERFEHPWLWKKYAAARRSLAERASLSARPFPKLQPASFAAWQADELMMGGPDNGNEYFLFHGTTKDALPFIFEGGFDPGVAGSGLFGFGSYFAENASKSDEYADPADGLHYLFLSRVSLGHLWKTSSDSRTATAPVLPGKRASYQSLRRGPWLEEFGAAADSLVHVVPPERAPRSDIFPWKHSEFVVYQADRAYPEFLLTYRRRTRPG